MTDVVPSFDNLPYRLNSNMRCQACRNIPLSLFLNLGEYDHSDNYGALSLSAAQCDLCALLLVYMEEVLESRAPEYADQLRNSDMKMYLEHVAYSSIHSIQMKFRGLEDIGFPELRFHSQQLPPKGSKWMWELPADTIKALKGETNSSECFELVRQWIRNCEKDHPACRGASSGWLPTRVIDVGSVDQDPHMLITSDHVSRPQNASYLALSHCWGKPPHDELHMTKTATLAARLDRIPFSSLPKTFQDAIIIARNIEVPYLWIDTFCIIQDSKPDWEVEAASMAQVYSGALCTIAASSSSNWSGGCFASRNKLKTTACDILWPKSNNGGEIAVDQKEEDVSLTIFPPLPPDTLKTCPLSRRGWSLQERRLSRRVLHYTDIELEWECRSWVATESNPLGCPQIPMAGHNVVGHDKGPYEQWRKIVEQYSSMQLTYWTDRLTALSGLAMQTDMARNGEQYLAGLWRGDLIRDLLWYRPKWLQPLNQSSEYLAPTWSWASRIGWVWTPVFRNMLGDELHDIASGPTILSAETSLAGKNGFAQITSGALRVIGCLRKAVAKKGETNPPGSEFGFPLFAEEEEKERYQICGNFTFDCEADPDGEPVYLLRMATKVWPERSYGQFLVIGLRPTGCADEEYERCGSGDIIDTQWFDTCEEKSITIV